MKRRDSWLGAITAAALIAGFLWTRGSGVGDGEGSSAAIDLSRADGSFELDGITVEMSAQSRPLRVFDPLRFTVHFTRRGEAIEVTEPRLDFNMTMDMGPHDYRLVRDATGAWVAEGVILPQCGSGSRLWFGDLTFEAEGEPHAARVRFELDPPRED